MFNTLLMLQFSTFHFNLHGPAKLKCDCKIMTVIHLTPLCKSP